MPDFDGADLIAGLKANGCTIGDDLFALCPIEGMGNGAVATRDIPSGTALFSIPSSYLLSEHTSTLSTHLKPEDWASLEGGWTRLILALMWEDSRAESPWRAYLDAMPGSFSTPMWWPAPDLALLKGTDIENRIGRASADRDYDERVAPLLAAYPGVFVGDFSKECYHRQGSRVLSRSFTVPRARVDAGYRKEKEEKEARSEDSDEEEEEEEEEQVAVMVPLADMLNAAYEMDNARLFSPDEEEDEEEDEEGEEKGEGEGEEQGDVSMRSAASAAPAASASANKASDDAYTMTTTRDINAGEQIPAPLAANAQYNTYSSPCNSELLRKYGHVDLLPFPSSFASQLPSSVFPQLGGNAGDEVELSGDLVLRAIAAQLRKPIEFDADGRPNPPWDERLEAWLEDADDTFILTLDPADGLPEELLSFVRLFLEDAEWERTKQKGKMPKPTPTEEVLGVIDAAITARLARYAAEGLEGDAEIVEKGERGSNAHNAAVVRLGEKRCLVLGRSRVAEMKRELKKRRIAERKEQREAKRRR
ncbi:nucleus protein [Trichosporon asahii var. asahii CBS 2479]|uniref:Nucleus protein n=1 Tax=Trichosporon asahii var. asahii (strain ATCC 90039 / CBS 2479 / JCM 2466 / KCTC 7840 / NBRC 103889/ NCYC 2677 / UAMH 7654) TaxID=1186058 RepID=J6F113_TRIAS|nr:nucleus protein [Trichosporon asahii var. asahii CBS 2479]EJT50619.1 nucleus protein [Trichosporon asahii var. asahii CBS 2479]